MGDLLHGPGRAGRPDPAVLLLILALLGGAAGCSSRRCFEILEVNPADPGAAMPFPWPTMRVAQDGVEVIAGGYRMFREIPRVVFDVFVKNNRQEPVMIHLERCKIRIGSEWFRYREGVRIHEWIPVGEERKWILEWQIPEEMYSFQVVELEVFLVEPSSGKEFVSRMPYRIGGSGEAVSTAAEEEAPESAGEEE